MCGGAGGPCGLLVVGGAPRDWMGPVFACGALGCAFDCVRLMALSVAERQSCVAVRLVECAELPLLLLLCLVQ